MTPLGRRAALLVPLTLALLSGCATQDDRHGTGDAPAHQLPKVPVDVIPMPDEFGNVATTCDGHGHRLFVMTHNTSDVPATVISDPSCSSTR